MSSQRFPKPAEVKYPWPVFSPFVEYGARVEILRLRVKEDPIQHRRAQDLKAYATGNHHRHTVG